MDFFHVPVLLSESIKALNIKNCGVYVDGTAGGGGHSEAILKKLDTGTLISIDQDPDAIRFLKEKLAPYKTKSVLVHDNFFNMDKILRDLSIDAVDGVLLDIGVSSFQFDTPQRGFSYRYDAPLDMRMSREGTSAADLVNDLPAGELERIIYLYGEEKFARRIAAAIVHERDKEPILTTGRLAEVISSAVPAKARREKGHPARRTFQALRIAVNNELEVLKRSLDVAISVLKTGGRLAVITFHSLEDKIVKTKMTEWAHPCTCPADFPVCVCGKMPKVKLINKRAIVPSKEEVDRNPRCRSAKLRICQKL